MVVNPALEDVHRVYKTFQTTKLSTNFDMIKMVVFLHLD